MKPHKNGNKKVQCMICSRSILSDHLKRHARTHKDILTMTEDEVREELRIRKSSHLQREANRQKVIKIAQQENIPIECCSVANTPVSMLDTPSLREDMLRDNKIYLYKIEIGKQISSIMDEGIVQEDSLTRDRKEALELFRKQRPKFDIACVKLRPWQEQAMKLIESPSERQVLWITGRRGNEGKSWFQTYMESLLGFNRVARVDLRIKHANICNVLKKRPLASVDIFSFNDARSVSGEEINLYRILEDIKDGQATTSKYDNDNIRFRTPNTVIIFSNEYPRTQKLSRDRWQIYNANQNGLNDVTLKIMKMRKDGYDIQNNAHLQKHQL